jgi:hypothetical protein
MKDRKRLTENRLRMATSTSNSRREIPEDYEYNPKKIKHLKHILHNVSVAVGTLTSAFNEFSRFKGPDISPDGRLGGSGYVLPLKDIKQSIQNSVYGLSDVADCLADELTNPRWGVKDDKEVKQLLKEKDDVVEKVDDEVAPKDDISPEDVTGNPEDNEEDADIPDMEVKMSNTKKNVLASAVRQSLLNFFR